MNPKKFVSSHIMAELLKAKDKEQRLEAVREKTHFKQRSKDPFNE